MNNNGGGAPPYRAIVVSDQNGVLAVYLVPVETAESLKGSEEYRLVEDSAAGCFVTVNNCIPVVLATYPMLAMELTEAFGPDEEYSK